MTPYGDTALGQPWLRWWLGAWLPALSYYLKQCPFIISEVTQQPPDGNFTRDTINFQSQFRQYFSKISFKNPRQYTWQYIQIDIFPGVYPLRLWTYFSKFKMFAWSISHQYWYDAVGWSPCSWETRVTFSSTFSCDIRLWPWFPTIWLFSYTVKSLI